MTVIRFLRALPLMALLAACGAQENDPGPGGVTVGEAQRLDDAAAMLEDRARSPADENAERAEQLRRTSQDAQPVEGEAE